jgi:ATP-dependent DNA helicase RecG
MTAIELKELIGKGETSTVQFKANVNNEQGIAQEMVAFANTKGGLIIIGVDDKTWDIIGLSNDDLRRLSNLLVNAASEHVKGPIFIETETMELDGKKVMLVKVPDGIDKPYKDKDGVVFLKNGANKRKVISNEEIARLLQSSGNMLADEMEIHGTSIGDIDEHKFAQYFKKEFDKTFLEKGMTYEQALKAKRVLRNNRVTLAGLLFFGKDPQSIRPAFTIKPVSYFGNEISGDQYRSKPGDLQGTIPDLFEKAMNFLSSNLHHIQKGQSFNSIGILEISKIALIELLQNALVHRDYFKNSPIRLLIFDDRVEIISPGRLPNSLTVEDIKYGNPVIRNNQLVAFSTHALPFSGLGSGVKRALEEEPNIELINDIPGEQFIVKIPRPEKKFSWDNSNLI